MTVVMLILRVNDSSSGMENPQYTFLTPTTISGDRQNVDVVAHELSHSCNLTPFTQERKFKSNALSRVWKSREPSVLGTFLA